jgi:hypothetical protein
MDAVRPGSVDELLEPAVSQGRAEPAAGPLNGVVPERVELRWRVVCGCGEFPLVIDAVPAEGTPRRS